MDTFELKKEQEKLARKIVLNDGFSKIKTIAGIDYYTQGKELLAAVVVCEFPSFKIIEEKTYLLHNPFPYLPQFLAYRVMPALIEAYNLLEEKEEPDLILVHGEGINHLRKLGLAAHLGLSLNKPVIGITENLPCGKVEQGKIILNNEIVGFEVKTREYAKPVYVSPGHLCTIGSALRIFSESIKFPHKMPEPLHLARKLAKKKFSKQSKEENNNLLKEKVKEEVKLREKYE